MPSDPCSSTASIDLTSNEECGTFEKNVDDPGNDEHDREMNAEKNFSSRPEHSFRREKFDDLEEDEDVTNVSASALEDMPNCSTRDVLKVVMDGFNLLGKKMNRIILSQIDLKKSIREAMEKNTLAPRVRNDPVMNFSEELDDKLPLKTLEEFEGLEKDLEDKNFYNSTALFMKNIGGAELHDLIQGILRRFINDSLAMKFNVEGKFLVKKDDEGNDKGRKLAFKDTKLYRCIIRAAKLKSNNIADEAVIRSKTIGPWLSGAPLRLKRLREKKEREARRQLDL